MGSIRATDSKSEAIRALFAAALADKPTAVLCSSPCRDTEAMAECLHTLGAGVTRTETGYCVHPLFTRRRMRDSFALPVGESATVLRLLLPFVSSCEIPVVLRAQGSLPARLSAMSFASLEAHGARLAVSETGISTLGGLTAGGFSPDASDSSQLVSGLLFALPLLDGDSVISLPASPVSAPYSDMTCATLEAFGIRVQKTPVGYFVPGNQHYRSPGRTSVGGDWSGSAFHLAAGVLGKRPVTVSGLDLASLQPDRRVLSYLEAFGARVRVTEEGIIAFPSALRGIHADLSDTPDLFPVLCTLGAFAEGETVLTGVSRLAHKESDRPSAMEALLAAVGVDVRREEDTFRIRGGARVSGPFPTSCDHRIVMAELLMCHALGVPAAEGIVTEALAKSDPQFADAAKEW